MQTVAEVLRETTRKASSVVGSRQYKGVIAHAMPELRKATAQQMKQSVGKPQRYTKKQGDLICQRISNGETLVSICNDMGLSFATAMEWMKDHEEYEKAYNSARKLMSVNLVEKLIDKTTDLKSEDALAARVRADVVKWVAAKFNPEAFADIKRIELKGEVNHKHTHELAPEQKRRIAESWLVSQEQDLALPAITAETTGPDLPALEGVAVQEICENEQGERPKRKRSAQPAKVSKRKPGRPRKITIDDPVA